MLILLREGKCVSRIRVEFSKMLSRIRVEFRKAGQVNDYMVAAHVCTYPTLGTDSCLNKSRLYCSLFLA